MRQIEARTQRAAMYVRMSTERQEYSIVNQSEAIERYADEHKLAIVKRFMDAGKSGLTLAGRPALRALLLEVLSAKAEFDHVLVYDVSRWGRFQDADESAYYEYTCKKARIRLHYCVEEFTNDGSPYSALLKAIKRTMAGEYSRELSAKVHAAQKRLASLGFHQGGTAGYGFRRLVVDANGNAKRLIGFGERKDLPTDRVLLVPGPASEIAIVRKIFQWFTTDYLEEKEIATTLNRGNVIAERCARLPDKPSWTATRVHQILVNPKYIGKPVYNKMSNTLGEGWVLNPADQWVCRDDGLKPLVDPDVFKKAQEIVQRRLVGPTSQQILAELSAFVKRTGSISERIISKQRDLPCMAVIIRHFKSLLVVYELIGYKPVRNYNGVGERRQKRTRAYGSKSLLELICAAVESGHLSRTFTPADLRRAFPGWSERSYYGLATARGVENQGAKVFKIRRVSHGRYEVDQPPLLDRGTPSHN